MERVRPAQGKAVRLACTAGVVRGLGDSGRANSGACRISSTQEVSEQTPLASLCADQGDPNSGEGPDWWGADTRSSLSPPTSCHLPRPHPPPSLASPNCSPARRSSGRVGAATGQCEDSCWGWDAGPGRRRGKADGRAGLPGLKQGTQGDTFCLQEEKDQANPPQSLRSLYPRCLGRGLLLAFES